MTKIISISFLLFSLSVKCQENTVSNGNEISGTGGHISHSIGQVFYSTVNTSSVSVTQGIQQTYITVEETSIEKHNEMTSMRVYPNPSTALIILELGNIPQGDFRYSLSDVSGKVLSEKIILNSKNTIDLLPYANGSYQLILFLNSEVIKSFKIIKN